MKICFATNNLHKFEEAKSALPSTIELIALAGIGCREELPETSTTIEGNSLQKAMFVFENYQVPCFADDSGLLVDALNGEPGVNTAYYAGPQKNDEDNINLLLANLRNQENRNAVFKTVITLIGVSATPEIFVGEVSGVIAREKKGDRGFGYDPVFAPQGTGLTFAEMSMAQKNAISHRAIAVGKLAAFLKTVVRI